MYYGTEQEYDGGADPNNRESLWPNYNTTSPNYILIRTLNAFRRVFSLAATPQVQRYSGDSMYAYTRGNVLVVLTNGGSESSPLNQTITDHPYPDGTHVCNIFVANDCVTIQGRQLPISLVNGQAKILIPVESKSDAFDRVLARDIVVAMEKA